MSEARLQQLETQELAGGSGLGVDIKYVYVTATTGVKYIGIAYRMTAGENLNDAEIVRMSTAADDRVIKVDANGDMPIGVCYGAATSGGDAWIIREGFALVAFAGGAGGTPTRGYVAYVSGTAGKAANAATVPAATEHWREIGHVVATGTAGGNQVVALHFN